VYSITLILITVSIKFTQIIKIIIIQIHNYIFFSTTEIKTNVNSQLHYTVNID